MFSPNPWKAKLLAIVVAESTVKFKVGSSYWKIIFLYKDGADHDTQAKIAYHPTSFY
jgi:hypothetical protein